MAGCIDQRQNTKCSGYRKGPKFRSWVCCAFAQFLILLPCSLSKCLGQDLTVSILPEGGTHILEYGRPLEMYCIAEQNYTSSDIKFTLGDKSIESEEVNSTTRRLYIQHLQKGTRTYYCRNTKSNKYCFKRVVVGSPPGDVADFHCLSKNFETLNCSFTTSELYAISYYLSFVINEYVLEPHCIPHRLENTNTRYCIWNILDSNPRYRQSEENLYFHLNASNPFGWNNQSFTVDHYAIVKPDAPSELKIIKNGTYSVTLEWKTPINVVDFLFCGVDHIIEYRIAKIGNGTHFHNIDASHLPSRNTIYEFNLTNLPYAHVQYEVRVSLKSKKAMSEDFWSDWSYLEFHTSSERPQRPPEMVAGAFVHNTYNDRRIIYVYWKQLEEFEEAGTNFTYKVVTSQGNAKYTFYPDKTQSLGYISLNATLDAVDVTVWSVNSVGSSLNSSYLYIPSDKQTHLLNPIYFTKIAHKNGTYELSWFRIKNIDNYTLFWCQNEESKVCTGRMDFAVLSSEMNRYVIELPNQYRYQFAIAANNRSQSSGMVWATDCEVSEDRYVMYGFPIRVMHDRPGKRFVSFKWKVDGEMFCAIQEGIVLGYDISYCPLLEYSSRCDESSDILHKYVDDALSTSTTVENLTPFTTYQFTFAVRTVYGLKNIENGNWMITTLP